MIFFSYSGPDIGNARAISEYFKRHHIPIWIDFRGLTFGHEFISGIADGLEQSDWYIILNPSSSLSSYWVRREYESELRLHEMSGQLSIASIGESTVASVWRAAGHQAFADVDEAIAFFSSRTSGFESSSSERGSLRIAMQDFQGNPVRFSSPILWFGYSSKLQELDDWLLSDAPGIFLVGPAATGKTALLRAWLFAFQRMGYPSVTSVVVQLVDGRVTPKLEVQFPRPGLNSEKLLLVIDPAEVVPTKAIKSICARAGEYSTRLVVVGQNAEVPDTFPRIEIRQLDKRDVLLLATESGLDTEQARVIEDITEGNPLELAIVLERMRKFRT